MKTCSECGSKIEEKPSNATREVTLTVPEEHFFLFRKLFREMNTKMGMLGLGEMANALNPYYEKFNDDREHLRYFDDTNLAMAQIGIGYGHPATIKVSKSKRQFVVEPFERFNIDIEFDLGKKKNPSMNVSEAAPEETVEWFKAYFEDYMERFRPMPGYDASDGPQAG